MAEIIVKYQHLVEIQRFVEVQKGCLIAVSGVLKPRARQILKPCKSFNRFVIPRPENDAVQQADGGDEAPDRLTCSV